ncbi:MAG TPA: hypothetical protein PKA64_08070, partial [Myxococcota bacterium]|nr:hypothetical protein [Myxococcota bacterium]
FVEVAPLVSYLLASDRVDAFIDTIDLSLSSFDVPAALEATARLLRADERPFDRALAIYNEVYDDDLLNTTAGASDTRRARPLTMLLATAQVATASMDACERSADPATCSAPLLLRRLLDTDLLDRVDRIATGLGTLPEDPTATPLLETLADMLLSMQAAENPGTGNVLLGLADFFTAPEVGDDGVAGDPPLLQLLDFALPLLDNDALLQSLASELARLDREGALAALPHDVEVLFTHDLDGNYVGFDGDTIVDALLDILGSLDPTLLSEPITLPGSDEPLDLVAVVLDTAEDLYQQDADIAEIVRVVGDLTDLICDAETSNELCTLVDDLLPPVTALLEQTTFVPAVILPLVHVLHEHADIPALLDFAPKLIAWDLLPRTQPLLEYSVEHDSLAAILDIVPVFLDDRLGRLRPEAWDAVGALRLLTHPLDVDGVQVTPLEVLLPLLRDMLHPSSPDADLDALTVMLASRMVDDTSALSVDNLLGLLDDLDTILQLEPIDLVATARDLLDDRDLWRAAIHVLADEQLTALLRPAPAGGDATWWLRDLIERQVVDRMLDWVAAILEQVADLGLLDITDSDEPEAP